MLAGFAISSSLASAADEGKPAAERDARIGWWREARFGMFIHWGLYAVPAGKFELAGVKGKVTKAYLLADRDKALPVTQDGGKLALSLPAQAPDPVASVVCLELAE